MAKSRNLPGVTKSLMWVRLGGVEGSQENCIELLDSPGIIPARQLDQEGEHERTLVLIARKCTVVMCLKVFCSAFHLICQGVECVSISSL